MPILRLEFLRSCPGPGQMPKDGRPEVAFAGRSNVGKSSLLNTLNRGGGTVARISSRPGCTQFLNVYSASDRFYLIDMPGYGYARAPEELRRQWEGWMLSYLADREPLRGVVLLVDARHPALLADMEMARMLRERGRPYLIALTKSDKLKRGKLMESVRTANEMGPVVAVSSKTGVGMDDVCRWLFETVS
jgi:GTP-binding protein